MTHLTHLAILAGNCLLKGSFHAETVGLDDNLVIRSRHMDVAAVNLLFPAYVLSKHRVTR